MDTIKHIAQLRLIFVGIIFFCGANGFKKKTLANSIKTCALSLADTPSNTQMTHRTQPLLRAFLEKRFSTETTQRIINAMLTKLRSSDNTNIPLEQWEQAFVALISLSIGRYTEASYRETFGPHAFLEDIYYLVLTEIAQRFKINPMKPPSQEELTKLVPENI